MRCAWLGAAAALVAGCASTPVPRDDAPWRAPGAAPAAERDGAEAVPPPDLERVPDPEPVVEPIREGGPNKPYEVLGQAYVPAAADVPLREIGLASWYGRKFHGRRTANGEVYNMYAMSAAHPTMPLPSFARVRNPENGREVVVRVNDRGPFHAGRAIDLSYTAALKLGVLGQVAPVEIERLTHDAIRSGNWRGPTVPTVDAAAPSTRSRPGALAGPGMQMAAAALPAVVDGVAAPGSAASDPASMLPSTSPSVPPVAGPAAPTSSARHAARAGRGPVAAEAAPVEAAPGAMPPAGAAPVADALVPQRATSRGTRGFWVQLGAFAQHAGAVGFQDRVSRELVALAPLLTIFSDRQLHRLQAGPYLSREDARAAADRMRGLLLLAPVVVERR